jgi:hypothetical protein
MNLLKNKMDQTRGLGDLRREYGEWPMPRSHIRALEGHRDRGIETRSQTRAPIEANPMSDRSQFRPIEANPGFPNEANRPGFPIEPNLASGRTGSCSGDEPIHERSARRLLLPAAPS